jgi:hypothetical protein
MGPEDVRPGGDQKATSEVPISHVSSANSEGAPAETTNSRYPLRGKPVRLVDPTQPVAKDEWEAAE